MSDCKENIVINMTIIMREIGVIICCIKGGVLQKGKVKIIIIKKKYRRHQIRKKQFFRFFLFILTNVRKKKKRNKKKGYLIY